MSEPLRPGTIWQHADGGLYRVHEEATMKHPETGEWLPCVIYRDPGRATYVTTKTRWLERFTPRNIDLGLAPFPQPNRNRQGQTPCGECHIQPDEICDICGASWAPKEGAEHE